MERLNSVELQSKRELRVLFEEVDSNDNGYISNRELRDFLTNNDHKLPPHVVNAIYERADRNGDGRLDFKEFACMVYDPKNRHIFGTWLYKYVNFILPPQRPGYCRSISEEEAQREYVDLVRCCPPPLSMVIISVVEILLFILDAVEGNVSGQGGIAQNLIYDPRWRYECWRYVTYMFVHVGYIHLCMNLVVQILLGCILEVFHRWWRVSLIYLSGVLAGSLGHFLFDPTHKLAGASGGVYSLITAHVATIILNWKEMRYPLSNLTVFLAFTVADLLHVFYSTDVHIGHTAHFCGGLAGLLVGVLILRNISLNRIERIMQFVAFIVYIGLMGIAIIWNIIR